MSKTYSQNNVCSHGMLTNETSSFLPYDLNYRALKIVRPGNELCICVQHRGRVLHVASLDPYKITNGHNGHSMVYWFIC